MRKIKHRMSPGVLCGAWRSRNEKDTLKNLEKAVLFFAVLVAYSVVSCAEAETDWNDIAVPRPIGLKLEGCAQAPGGKHFLVAGSNATCVGHDGNGRRLNVNIQKPMAARRRFWYNTR